MPPSKTVWLKLPRLGFRINNKSKKDTIEIITTLNIFFMIRRPPLNLLQSFSEHWKNIHALNIL
jgi:hypothetical protein